MAKIFNRAQMSTSTTGTGTITLGSATTGYQDFAAAGVANADVVYYLITDGSNWEIGTGTYTSSGTTLSRTVIESTNSDTAISLSGSAVVSIVAPREQTQTKPEFTGSVNLTGIITPTALASGSQNNYAPTGLSTTTVIRITAHSSDSTLTGLTAGTAGQLVYLVNIATSATDELNLSHQSASSTAANRFFCPGSTTYTLQGNEGVLLWYDGTSAGWRIIGAERSAGGLAIAATAADQETGTSTTAYVTPGQQDRNLGHPKCQGHTTGAGTAVLASFSYNVSSISDGTSGTLTVNLTTAFSSASWSGVVTATNTATSGATQDVFAILSTKATTSFQIFTRTGGAGSVAPTTGVDWACFGDQV